MRLVVLREFGNSVGRHHGSQRGGPITTRFGFVLTPQPRVKWSLRNNVNMQESAILLAMNFVSNNKDRFLKNFYLKTSAQ